jgi:hypothetical protein
MKNLIYITIAIFFAAQVGCKKEPEKFKIKGRIMDGTTGQRFKGLTFTVHTKGGTANKINGDLGSFTTNDSGDFEFMYEKIKGISTNSISVISNFMKFENISLNQNVDKVFYNSTLGTVRISLQKVNPINFNDTLFLLYDKNPDDGIEEIIIDSIINPQDGFYKQIRTSSKRLVFHYGINSELKYDILNSKFNILQGRRFDFNTISGDPILDNCTIKF